MGGPPGGGPPLGMGGPPGGGPPPGMGGPPPGMGGPESQQPQNKVQRIKPSDVWDAIRKSLKKGVKKDDEQDGQN